MRGGIDGKPRRLERIPAVKASVNPNAQSSPAASTAAELGRAGPYERAVLQEANRQHTARQNTALSHRRCHEHF
jgi:hypothetical protein